METREVTVSFVVKVDGRVAFEDITLDWIQSDDAQAIAKDIKNAIESID